jgi:hypothetical protein
LKDALLRDTRTITITDLGAGSNISRSNQRSSEKHCSNSAKELKYGRLLHRLVAHFQPKEMAELGTSLGVSALYQATGNPVVGSPHLKVVQKRQPLPAKILRKPILLMSRSLKETLMLRFNRI